MRIIGGKYKHRRFDVPKTFNARPTTDFAKENLFNLLSNQLDFASTRALDLFSGTGSISAELLSRGCPFVSAVEMRRQHILFILEVIKTIGEMNNFHLHKMDVLDFLKRGGKGERFDFIFADPPYKMPQITLLPELIRQSALLQEEGLLVVEHPREVNFSFHEALVDHRAYGSVNFSFFRF